MFLQHKRNCDLIEVLNISDLFDPCRGELLGRFHAGEEMQEPETFIKSEVQFPSGESLPQCWLNPNYREQCRLVS